MEEKLKIFVAGTILGMSIGFGTMSYINNKIDKQPVIYTVTITNDYINVREKPSTESVKITEVILNEEYEIYEIYEEDDKYIWYKIKLPNTERRFGWIASDRDEAYLEVSK